MAKTNFKYEKRIKELAKQKKAEEKRQRRMEKRNEPTGETAQEPDEAAYRDAD